MDLIDLKKDPQPIDSNEMYDEPMYSYGLCISLGREELEKLGIEKLPEAGSEMMIKAITYVKTVRESKEKDGVEQNVELQICAMGIDPIALMPMFDPTSTAAQPSSAPDTAKIDGYALPSFGMGVSAELRLQCLMCLSGRKGFMAPARSSLSFLRLLSLVSFQTIEPSGSG